MYLYSIDAVADDILDQLDAPSLKALRETKEEDVSIFHLTWGMGIRNHYGLWKPDHPLTQNWHSNPDDRNLIDGIDHSEDHPDAVSMKIMKRVYKKANS